MTGPWTFSGFSKEQEMRMTFAIFAMLVALMTAAAQPASAQALTNQTLGLYPKSAGEVAYLNMKSLRSSPHYPQLKAQVLPERFRNLEQWADYMGIEFEKDIHQLSWAYLPAGADGQVGLIGIAEGTLTLAEVESAVKKKKLDAARYRGHLVVSLGKTETGKDFVFAFVDQVSAIFGYRDIAQEMLDRRALGGESLLNNAVVMGLVQRVNGRAPVWMALDRHFTLLGIKQMLPEASNLPGFDALAAKVESSILQFEITDGMKSTAEVRCQSSSDAVVLSTLMQGALTYQTWRLNESNPDLAKALGGMNLNRENERVLMVLALRQDEFTNLLSKNSFALKF
jgi:hypothetical protein